MRIKIKYILGHSQNESSPRTFGLRVIRAALLRSLCRNYED